MPSPQLMQVEFRLRIRKYNNSIVYYRYVPRKKAATNTPLTITEQRPLSPRDNYHRSSQDWPSDTAQDSRVGAPTTTRGRSSAPERPPAGRPSPRFAYNLRLWALGGPCLGVLLLLGGRPTALVAAFGVMACYCFDLADNAVRSYRILGSTHRCGFSMLLMYKHPTT